MTNKKQPNSEPNQEVSTEQRNPDLERRLSALEDSIVEIRKNQLESHKWFTTGMFTLVALLLTVLGLTSRSDVRDSIRDMKDEMHQSRMDMQAKVDASTADMNHKFEMLSGEALKKPALRVFTKEGQLEGQVFKVPVSNLPKAAWAQKKGQLLHRLVRSLPGSEFNSFL